MVQVASVHDEYENWRLSKEQEDQSVSQVDMISKISSFWLRKQPNKS